MEHGQVDLDTNETTEAIDRYFSLVKHEQNLAGQGTVKVNKVTIMGTDSYGRPSHSVLTQGCNTVINLMFTVIEQDEPARMWVSIDDESASQIITCPLVDASGQHLEYTVGNYCVRIELGSMELNSGKYSILVSASGARSSKTLVRSQGNAPFRVIAAKNMWSKIVRPVVPIVSAAE